MVNFIQSHLTSKTFIHTDSVDDFMESWDIISSQLGKWSPIAKPNSTVHKGLLHPWLATASKLYRILNCTNLLQVYSSYELYTSYAPREPRTPHVLHKPHSSHPCTFYKWIDFYLCAVLHKIRCSKWCLRDEMSFFYELAEVSVSSCMHFKKHTRDLKESRRAASQLQDSWQVGAVGLLNSF